MIPNLQKIDAFGSHQVNDALLMGQLHVTRWNVLTFKR